MDFSKEEKEDLIQSLNASVCRLRGKIINDTNNNRLHYDRVGFRKQKIERAKILIQKIQKQ